MKSKKIISAAKMTGTNTGKPVEAVPASSAPKIDPIEQALVAIKDPANTFKYYDESSDEEYFLHLSTQFVEYLYKHKYLLLKKIGQGSYNSAYTAKKLDTNETVVLLLPGFDSTGNEIIPINFQYHAVKQYPDIPYDTEKIKITDSKIYSTESKTLYISVLEKADYTVAELFYQHRFDSIHDKHRIITKLQKDFAIIVKSLVDNKLRYCDLLLDNLAYIDDRLVLIDLENLSVSDDEEEDDTKKLLEELKWLIFDTFFSDEDIAYAEKTKSWKHVAAFFNSSKELDEYKSLYN